MAARARRDWERLAAPATVVSQSDDPQLVVRVPADLLGERLRMSSPN